jgi:hypothetical protein
MMGVMAAISTVAHAAIPDAPARPQKGGDRAAMDFGGAVTYRDLVDAKLRVDPVSLAEKKRQADPVRRRDAPPTPRDDDYEEPGSRLDISV